MRGGNKGTRFFTKVIVPLCLVGLALRLLCACATVCTSPAVQTLERVAKVGIDAERDSRLIACVSGDWETSLRVGNVNG